MIGDPRRGRGKSPTIGTQGDCFYKKDATTINPIMAMPVTTIETSTATIDFAFMDLFLLRLFAK